MTKQFETIYELDLYNVFILGSPSGKCAFSASVVLDRERNGDFRYLNFSSFYHSICLLQR